MWEQTSHACVVTGMDCCCLLCGRCCDPQCDDHADPTGAADQ